jgi:hypothetical protein
LDRADVVAVLDKMGGEGMPEGVAGTVLRDATASDGIFDCSLEERRIGVVALFGTGIRIVYSPCGGEEILPRPFPRGVGVFPLEVVGEGRFPEAIGKILSMEIACSSKVVGEGRDAVEGEDRDSVPPSLWFSEGDGSRNEINIFNAEGDAFREPESGAIEQGGHESWGAVEGVEDAVDFFAGEDDGEVSGALCTGDGAKRAKAGVEDVPVE